jgi:hypothetical protein
MYTFLAKNNEMMIGRAKARIRVLKRRALVVQVLKRQDLTIMI